MKFWPSLLLKRNSLIFWGAELEATIQILLKLSIALQCEDSKFAVSVFCPTNLSFKQNKPIKFEILIFSPAQKKFTHFFDFAETFNSPSVSGEWTALSVFCPRNLSFTQFVFSNSAQKKLGEFSSSRRADQNFKFHRLVFSKR